MEIRPMTEIHQKRAIASLARQRNRQDGQAGRQRRLPRLEAARAWNRQSARRGSEYLPEDSKVCVEPSFFFYDIYSLLVLYISSFLLFLFFVVRGENADCYKVTTHNRQRIWSGNSQPKRSSKSTVSSGEMDR